MCEQQSTYRVRILLALVLCIKICHGLHINTTHHDTIPSHSPVMAAQRNYTGPTTRARTRLANLAAQGDDDDSSDIEDTTESM
jgi:hypothetical protein